MFAEILAAALCAAGLIFLLWLLRGVMLTPLRIGSHTRLTLTLTVDGAEPHLEETLDGLLWLIQNGTLTGNIVIVDKGMDGETKLLSRLFARDRALITLTESEDTDQWEREQTT